MKLFCGTSGFSYKEWKGPFYPEKLADKDMLNYYAQKLSAVEINNTFYRMPKERVLSDWAAQTNRDFKFSIKASQKITHYSRLKDTDEACAYLFKNVRSLKERLGCVLFQLPPYLKKDIPRLDNFLKLLPHDLKAAFEFRHESWADPETYDLLKSKNCALVITETDEKTRVDFQKTADWSYLRFRRTSYTNEALQAHLKKIISCTWSKVFVFF